MKARSKGGNLKSPGRLAGKNTSQGVEAMPCSHVISNRRTKTRLRSGSLGGYRQASGQEHETDRCTDRMRYWLRSGKNCSSCNICRVGQNQYVYGVYTVILAGKHQIYGHIQRIYTVLANPKYLQLSRGSRPIRFAHSRMSRYTYTCRMSRLVGIFDRDVFVTFRVAFVMVSRPWLLISSL